MDSAIVNNGMGSFRTFVEQQEFVEFAQQAFQAPAQTPRPDKKWSASKDEILQMWKNLRVDTPIYLTPMKKNKGSDNTSYNQDGIRITGSRQFIGSVLARLKEILRFENPHTKLRLVFRSVDKDQTSEPAFVFYVNSEMRGKGKAGRPKKKGLI